MVSRREFVKGGACAATIIASATEAEVRKTETRKIVVDPDGTVHVPAYRIPLSLCMSDDAKRAYITQSLRFPRMQEAADIGAVRAEVDRLWHAPLVRRARAKYPVEIKRKLRAGTQCFDILPQTGFHSGNENRVLINLHGGGLTLGSGLGQLLESIPIAVIAGIRVISVDYRLAPEHKFPAPMEDISAVYSEVLKSYRAKNIGIYGHSVGGALSAMCIPWFRRQNLPKPGAIGMLSAENAISNGDSWYTTPPLSPLFGGNAPPPPPPLSNWPLGYFEHSILRTPSCRPLGIQKFSLDFRPRCW